MAGLMRLYLSRSRRSPGSRSSANWCNLGSQVMSNDATQHEQPIKRTGRKRAEFPPSAAARQILTCSRASPVCFALAKTIARPARWSHGRAGAVLAANRVCNSVSDRANPASFPRANSTSARATLLAGHQHFHLRLQKSAETPGMVRSPKVGPVAEEEDYDPRWRT